MTYHDSAAIRAAADAATPRSAAATPAAAAAPAIGAPSRDAGGLGEGAVPRLIRRRTAGSIPARHRRPRRTAAGPVARTRTGFLREPADVERPVPHRADGGDKGSMRRVRRAGTVAAADGGSTSSEVSRPAARRASGGRRAARARFYVRGGGDGAARAHLASGASRGRTAVAPGRSPPSVRRIDRPIGAGSTNATSARHARCSRGSSARWGSPRGTTRGGRSCN
jgi:hypothetical protein